MSLFQIPDPSTLESVTKYLPAFSIIALGFVSWYLIRFVISLITKEKEFTKELMQTQTSAIQSITTSVESLNTKINEDFNKIETVIKTEAADIKSKIIISTQ